MRIRNHSNQTVNLKRTDAAGQVLDSVLVSPGDHDVHESWRDIVATHPLVNELGANVQPYEGPTQRRFVDPPKHTAPGEPESAVKHDDQPKTDGPHPGRPNPNPSAEEIAKAKADAEEELRKAQDSEADKRKDERGPGTRRRDG